MALTGCVVLPGGDVWTYRSDIDNVSFIVNARSVVLSCQETVVDVTEDEEKYGADIERNEGRVEVFIRRDGERVRAGIFAKV